MYIIGIDEAGRGPWAGPVVASACTFDPKNKEIKKLIPLLGDSKQLSIKKRNQIREKMDFLAKHGHIFYGIGVVESDLIDELGIKKANKYAMELALKELFSKIHCEKVSKIKVDGNDKYVFEENVLPTEYIIRGDSKINEIKAASIIAKTTRDELMDNYAKQFPDYGFEKHKGYGTALHQRSLELHGICEIHRKSYAPIKRMMIGT